MMTGGHLVLLVENKVEVVEALQMRVKSHSPQTSMAGYLNRDKA